MHARTRTHAHAHTHARTQTAHDDFSIYSQAFADPAAHPARPHARTHTGMDTKIHGRTDTQDARTDARARTQTHTLRGHTRIVAWMYGLHRSMSAEDGRNRYLSNNE